MHGPCGIDGPKCPCMKKGVGSKRLPKSFQNETSIDESGFPLYKRPENGHFVTKNNVRLDNRHVVPYNMLILKNGRRILMLNGVTKLMLSNTYTSTSPKDQTSLKPYLRMLGMVAARMLMRSKSIGSVVILLTMILFGGSMGLTYIVKHPLLRDCLFIS